MPVSTSRELEGMLQLFQSEDEEPKLSTWDWIDHDIIKLFSSLILFFFFSERAEQSCAKEHTLELD